MQDIFGYWEHAGVLEWGSRAAAMSVGWFIQRVRAMYVQSNHKLLPA